MSRAFAAMGERTKPVKKIEIKTSLLVQAFSSIKGLAERDDDWPITPGANASQKETRKHRNAMFRL